MIYEYEVTIYGKEPLNGKRCMHAESAVHAVEIARAFMGYAGGFQYTTRFQNAPDEASRDNAHVQFDRDGLSGCAAVRLVTHRGKRKLPQAFRNAQAV
jgi:hypothetical protein